jgi:hypothetical protein
MSAMPPFGSAQQLEIGYPVHHVPTYYVNVVQTHLLGEEVYLDFCMRSADKPHLRADCLCRVVMTANNLKRLNEGFANVIQQLERAIKEQLRAQQVGGGNAASAMTGGDEGGPVDMVEELASEFSDAPPPKAKKRGGGGK